MTNLNEMKSTELKEMGKTLGVKNWWLLKKTDLIVEIEKLTMTEQPAEEEIVIHEIDLNELIEDEKKKVKPETKAAEPTEEIADEDIVTLKEIIHRMGIKGTKARRLLRNADIVRPYKRWEWHKEQHKHIIEKVKGLLK
jgi:hypothetical protein